MKKVLFAVAAMLMIASCGGGTSGSPVVQPGQSAGPKLGLGLKWFPNIVKGRIPFDQYVLDVTKMAKLKAGKLEFLFDQAVFIDPSMKPVSNIDFIFAAYGSSNLLGSMLDFSITENGKYAILESYGLIYFNPKDAKGADLQLKQGSYVTVNIPAPYGLSDTVIKTLKVYAFDMNSAVWVSMSTPEVKDIGGNKYLSFKATHFSYWMVAAPISMFACVKGQVKAPALPADADILVIACGENYTGMTRTYIKNNGTYELDVKMNSSVTIYALAEDSFQIAGFLVANKVVDIAGSSKLPEGSGNNKQKIMNMVIQKDGYSAIKMNDDLYQIKAAKQYEQQNNSGDTDKDAQMQKEFDEMNKLLDVKPSKTTNKGQK
ncbi:MAG: hypothetical protein A2Y33_02815 [Spirochaetes bacterium GWF1_51_8]|nr:MAG: hypothetical protein A2Y33_02815 [Spirochaetes bacterium GWF1_51_8]